MVIVDQTDATDATTNVETVINSMLDPSDPLYLHLSDNPRAMLVSVDFSGIGYRSWRRAILRGLSVKNKTGFISGECKRPDPQSPKFWQWEQYDDMELEDRYEQTNGVRLYQIQKEINDLSQGVLDIIGYYTQLKKLWEELSTLSAKTQCSCQCTCGVKETFSLLIQDEKQQEMISPNHMVTESISLHANASGNANNFRNNNFITNYTPNANFPNTNRSRPFYDYCKRPGHTKDKCFKLHGYPQTSSNNQNLKYNKNKRVVANAHSNLPDEMSAKIEEFGPKDESQNLNLSKEQYGQLLSILQHLIPAVEERVHITQTMELDQCFRTWTDTWILDSGASNHMTFNKISLVDIRILPYPLLVTLPNGYRVKVTKIGSVYLAPQITLHKVMFVPSFKFNLLSVSSLTVQLKFLIAFTDTCYLLQTPSIKRPLEIGKIGDGLYPLCSLCLKSANPVSTSVSSLFPASCHACDVHSLQKSSSSVCDHSTSQSHSFSSINNSICNKTPNYDSSLSHKSDVNVLLHNRLGHVPIAKIRSITIIPATFSARQPFLCSICLMDR
ncbi:uncharacterized protein [Nicotiana tomentosiformis]|uniref:uncharacterized protein n=1 Tax=Nicotiana tomentosiformis TaxID=4098 RepID=UPI00388CE1BF